MKINKIFAFINKPAREQYRRVPSYNPNDVTMEEFREFVQYLAKNNINRTFIEPKKFTTEAERQELQKFRDRIRYLAENNVNQVFIC